MSTQLKIRDWKAGTVAVAMEMEDSVIISGFEEEMIRTLLPSLPDDTFMIEVTVSVKIHRARYFNAEEPDPEVKLFDGMPAAGKPKMGFAPPPHDAESTNDDLV